MEETHGKTVERNQMILGDVKYASMCIDGWKNSSAHSKCVPTLLQNKSNVVIVDAVDTTETEDTEAVLVDLVKNSVEKAQILYDVEVVCVVSDNAHNMVAMGNNLPEGIWFSRCNAHIANLLMKDFGELEHIKKTLKEVMLIQREFTKLKLERAVTNKGGNRIELTCATRWCSNRDCVQNFLDNYPYYLAVKEDGLKIEYDITLMLEEESIEELIIGAQNVLSVLNPIAVALNKFQAKGISLSECVDVWIDLIMNADQNSLLIINRRIERNKALSDLALAAYTMDHRYKGARLNDDQKQRAMVFICQELGVAGLESKAKYSRGEGIFGAIDREDLDPDVFWKLAEVNYAELAKLGRKLACIPGSSAQLERVFSNWALVHSNVRNRLGPKKSEKLIYIYYSNRVNMETKFFEDEVTY